MKTEARNEEVPVTGRFAAVGGAEYEWLVKVLTWYGDFQADVGSVLQEACAAQFSGAESIHILELGTGTGLTTEEILKADSRIAVTTIDNEPAMLGVAQARLGSSKAFEGRVFFVENDLLRHLRSLGDRSVDGVVSVFTLHNFPLDLRKQVLVEVARVLKSGGIIVFGDKFSQDDERLHAADLAEELANIAKIGVFADEAEASGDADLAQHLRQLKAEWDVHYLDDDKIRGPVREQEEILQEIGFVGIRWSGKRFDLVTTVSAIKA